MSYRTIVIIGLVLLYMFWVNWYVDENNGVIGFLGVYDRETGEYNWMMTWLLGLGIFAPDDNEENEQRRRRRDR